MNAVAEKWALITGASGGIGLELAELLAADGWSLVLVARGADKLSGASDRLSQKYGIRTRVEAVDLVREEGARSLYKALCEAKIYPEYLINNAGVGNYGRFAESDLQKDLDLIRLNVTALTLLTKLFLKDMISRKSGRILNIASTAAYMPGPYMASYYASKAYVLSFSEALAEELRGSGVTVTAACPGPTRTGFHTASDLVGARTFSGPLVMDAGQVARIAYDAMKRGRRVVVTGWINCLMVAGARFSPRNWTATVVRYLQEKVKTHS